MSSPVMSAPVVTASKKARVATLPAKFSKFIQFGFHLVKQINSTAAQPIDEAAFLEHIRMFDSVDVQQAFVQKFFDESKENNQIMRKAVHVHKKIIAQQLKKASMPPKAPKVKRVRATTNANKKIKNTTTDASADANTDASADATAPAPKKSRAKKASSTDDFVAEMVSLATSTTPAPEPEPAPAPTLAAPASVQEPVENVVIEHVTEPVTAPAAKPDKQKATKAKATKEVVAPIVTAPVVTATVASKPEKKVKAKATKEATAVTENKPKAKRAAKAKPAVDTTFNNTIDTTIPSTLDTTINNTIDTTDTDDDDDLVVEPFLLNGTQYLIDDLCNVYHFDSHALIGTLDSINNSITTI